MDRYGPHADDDSNDQFAEAEREDFNPYDGRHISEVPSAAAPTLKIISFGYGHGPAPEKARDRAGAGPVKPSLRLVRGSRPAPEDDYWTAEPVENEAVAEWWAKQPEARRNTTQDRNDIADEPPA